MDIQMCNPMSSFLRYLEVMSPMGLLLLLWSIHWEWEYFAHKCVLECGARTVMQLSWVPSGTALCNGNSIMISCQFMFKEAWCQFNVQILDFISIQFSNNSAEVILLPPFSGLNKVWSQICFCFNAVLPYLLQSSLCGQFKSDLVCPVIRIWDLQSKTSKPKAACLFLFLLCIFSSIYGITFHV